MFSPSVHWTQNIRNQMISHDLFVYRTAKTTYYCVHYSTTRHQFQGFQKRGNSSGQSFENWQIWIKSRRFLNIWCHMKICETPKISTFTNSRNCQVGLMQEISRERHLSTYKLNRLSRGGGKRARDNQYQPMHNLNI